MRCFISGRVQGVWYRASTKKKAEQLEIKGWAKNLEDGRVEVFACANNEALEILYNWLKQGPPMAKVLDIIREDLPWQDYDGFDAF